MAKLTWIIQRSNGFVYEFESSTNPGTLANGTRVIGLKSKTDPLLCRPIQRLPIMRTNHSGEPLHVPAWRQASIGGIIVKDV